VDVSLTRLAVVRHSVLDDGALAFKEEIAPRAAISDYLIVGHLANPPSASTTDRRVLGTGWLADDLDVEGRVAPSYAARADTESLVLALDRWVQSAVAEYLSSLAVDRHQSLEPFTSDGTSGSSKNR
jgi:hypothetical protein